MKPVIYVVVNKSLNMSPGKLAAQVGHAVAMSMMLPSLDKVIAGDHQQSWATAHHKWLIVLEATDTVHLANIERYLDDRNVHSHIIIDEGVNEVPPFSATALGVQILDKDSPEAALLSGLKKYDHRDEQRARDSRCFQNGAASRKWRYRSRLASWLASSPHHLA